MQGNYPLLQMTGISKSFPGVKALDNVDLTLYAGEVLALLGENGAGKSTLLKILSGAYHKDAGEIFLDGKPISINNPKDAYAAGIRIIYQELTRITKEIEDGDFFKNEALLKAVENVKKNDSSLHCYGLVSPGGVHSHDTHIYGLLELAKREGLKKVYEIGRAHV